MRAWTPFPWRPWLVQWESCSSNWANSNWPREGIKPVMRYHDAANREACLEWVRWIMDQVCLYCDTKGILLFETLLAKEASSKSICWGNLLDCLLQGTAGIAVRTKWRSGSAYGNIAAQNLNGNSPNGDVWVFYGEILPDLSRKVYLSCYHHLHLYIF